jgi:hypothetical protein
MFDERFVWMVAENGESFDLILKLSSILGDIFNMIFLYYFFGVIFIKFQSY